MKNKAFYLSTCDTCARIIKDVGHRDAFDWIDIKHNNIDEESLDYIKDQTGSYEAIFSRRARKYISQGWNKKKLKEEDFRRLILEEYTFLKRPVFIYNKKAFVGNTKAVIAQLKQALDES